jgi:hypothetical protein
MSYFEKIRLAEVTGDHMKLLLRDIFPIIVDGLKVPNKTMSGYVDNCILNLIKNVTFKSGLPVLSSEIREHKAKFVRERCLVMSLSTSHCQSSLSFNSRFVRNI